MKFYLKDRVRRIFLKSSSLFCIPLDRNQTRALPLLEQLFETNDFKLNTLMLNGEQTKLKRKLFIQQQSCLALLVRTFTCQFFLLVASAMGIKYLILASTNTIIPLAIYNHFLRSKGKFQGQSSLIGRSGF